jgi:hypothetical protein
LAIGGHIEAEGGEATLQVALGGNRRLYRQRRRAIERFASITGPCRHLRNLADASCDLRRRSARLGGAALTELAATDQDGRERQ